MGENIDTSSYPVVGSTASASECQHICYQQRVEARQRDYTVHKGHKTLHSAYGYYFESIANGACLNLMEFFFWLRKFRA